MQRIELADLMAAAVNKPELLHGRYNDALRDAGAPLADVVDEARERWLSMTADLARAKLVEVC